MCLLVAVYELDFQVLPKITLLKPLTWEKFSFVITKPPFMPV